MKKTAKIVIRKRKMKKGRPVDKPWFRAILKSARRKERDPITMVMKSAAGVLQKE